MAEEISSYTSEKIYISKGYAIIAVIFSHILYQTSVEVYLRELCNPCVGIFFFWAGYLADTNHIWEKYGRRILRVLIPYVIWSVIYTLWSGDYLEFGIKLLTGRCCATFYFMFVYVQLMLLLPLWAWLLQQKYWWIGFFPTVIWFVVITTYSLLGNYLMYPWNVNLFPVWLAVFYLGICVRYGKVKVPKKIYYALPAGLFLEYAESLYWHARGREDLATSPAKSATMFFAILVCLGFYVWSKKDWPEEMNPAIMTLRKILCLFGECSFGIYLIHTLVITALSKYTNLWELGYGAVIPVVLGLNLILVLALRKLLPRSVGKWIGVY